ncbi:MAG: response regulator [Desulfoarculaceae bacterium]|nr:response regulator [Desulfoarculaceae bacterium]
MKILLVDDEFELVSTLAERLSLRGIDADWATSGESALAKLQDTTYDLAVLDIKMPKISGLKLRKKIQKIQPEMRYIFMTGHGSAEDFYSASSEEGPDSYLVKPVNIDDLIAKITAILAP